MKKIKRVEFFNGANKGDVFLSRGVISWTVSNVSAEEYVYERFFDDKLIRDLKGVKPLRYKRNEKRSQLWTYQNNILRANVSYMVGTQYWDGTCAKTLLSALKGEIPRLLGIPVNATIEDIIPTIDFSYFKTQLIDDLLKDIKDSRKILICNNDTNSGQAVNFDMNPLIEYISDKCPGGHVFVSNDTDKKVLKQNVHYISDFIIEKDSADLIEISYVGKHCNLVIGRGSGPYTHCLTKENMHNPLLKFIGFCGGLSPMSFGLESIYKNKFFNNPAKNCAEAINFFKSIENKL